MLRFRMHTAARAPEWRTSTAAGLFGFTGRYVRPNSGSGVGWCSGRGGVAAMARESKRVDIVEKGDGPGACTPAGALGARVVKNDAIAAVRAADAPMDYSGFYARCECRYRCGSDERRGLIDIRRVRNRGRCRWRDRGRTRPSGPDRQCDRDRDQPPPKHHCSHSFSRERARSAERRTQPNIATGRQCGSGSERALFRQGCESLRHCADSRGFGTDARLPRIRCAHILPRRAPPERAVFNESATCEDRSWQGHF